MSDGKRFLDRETVDDDPAHVEPVAPGVDARVEPLRGALGFRQVTQTARWKLTKTWITDPARAAVLARVRFQSRTGTKLRLYVLADPAPGDDGDDDRGMFVGGELLGYDEEAASAVAAEPRLRDGSSGYKGATSDPWRDLRADGRLRGYDAPHRGNVVQGARTALDGVRRRELTLAIGFGADPAEASATAGAALAAVSSKAIRRFAWLVPRSSLPSSPGAGSAST